MFTLIGVLTPFRGKLALFSHLVDICIDGVILAMANVQTQLNWHRMSKCPRY